MRSWNSTYLLQQKKLWLFLFQAQKEYFTVIKNVKKAHQIQDSGEFQVRLNEMCQIFFRNCTILNPIFLF